MQKHAQTIVDLIPLKQGKLEAFQKFLAESIGPRRKEYCEMLARYGLKTTDVYLHKIKDVDVVIVVHQADSDAREKLKNFSTSDHPTEKWFAEELSKLFYFEPLNGEPQEAKSIFSFVPD